MHTVTWYHVFLSNSNDVVSHTPIYIYIYIYKYIYIYITLIRSLFHYIYIYIYIYLLYMIERGNPGGKRIQFEHSIPTMRDYPSDWDRNGFLKKN